MRLAIDATALPARPGGAGRYIVHLVKGLCRLPIDGRLFVFTRAGDAERLGPWPPFAEPVVVRVPGRVGRLAWEQTSLPLALRRLRVDLLHSPHYTLPLAPVASARVVTFHDMAWFLVPEYLPAAKRAFFRPMIRAAARRADLVIAVSETTRRDACRLLDLDPSRTLTVHEAADESFAPVEDAGRLGETMRRHGLRRPFVLTVATLEPRKNVRAAIHAVASLRRAGGDWQLAVAGARGWATGPLFDEVRRAGVGEHVRLLGYVPDEDLPALYSACDVFLYPSLYEGFGLPPLEAMACGATVIVASRGALPEVVGDGGLQYDPDDEEGLAQLITGVVADGEPAREHWRRRAIARAACFSWERAARETYDGYRRVLARIRG